jgi:low molecular weight phosphotyrosine protein phosphatase
MSMDEEGDLDPVIPNRAELDFHMQIDERISNIFLICCHLPHSLITFYTTQPWQTPQTHRRKSPSRSSSSVSATSVRSTLQSPISSTNTISQGRSPMAEGVFRHITNHNLPTAHPLISSIDSCGTGAYHAGEPSDPRTMAVLKAHKIKYAHKARKFRNSDLKEFDYVFAMDTANEEYLLDARKRMIKKGELSEEEAAKVMLFGVWGGKGQEEVDDPYYGGARGFDVAYEQVERFSNGFVKMLEERGSGKN